MNKNEKSNILLTNEEKEIIFNAMIQMIEWQSESFTKKQLEIIENLIKKIKNASDRFNH